MNNLVIIIVFVLGFILILRGGDILINSAITLARKAKIPPVVVGATIVSIATTFPETTVALLACKNGAIDIGINTAVGAMVCNFTIVLGVAFLIFPTAVNGKSFISKSIFFIGAILFLLVVSLNGTVNTFESIILLCIFVAFILYSAIESLRNKASETGEDGVYRPWPLLIIEFVIAAAAIGLGAVALVNNVDSISQMLGINGGLVGFIIIAVGTNIPELVTTITSVKLNSPEIGIGNIFGSSIINCTLLISLSVFVSSYRAMPISRLLILISVPILLLITIIIVVPIIKRERSFRWQGVALIIIYFVYTSIVIACT